MAFSKVLIASTILSVVYARNNWNQACLSGSCSYDLPERDGGASGTIQIWGSPESISDITSAAGWEILDCDSDALSQEIRLVCRDENSAECAHLFDGEGAVDKLVRLPEDCGSSPFARVARAWVSEDQSIPAHVAARVVRRDGQHPKVKALKLDTDFEAADATKTGHVYFALQAANVPGVSAKRDLIARPSFNSRISGRAADDFVTQGIEAITSSPYWDINKSVTFPPLDINKSVNLVNQAVSCGAISAGLKVDVSASAHAVMSIGAVASGSIFPPKISSFAVTGSLTADLNGTLTMAANVGGTLDSGRKVLVQPIGIPGFSIPGILTVGPSIEIDGQAIATLDLNVDLTVGVNYHITKASFTLPAKSGSNGVTSSIGNTPLKLSLSPSIKATGKIEGHLIPRANIGVSAFGTKAGIFLDLDASASMALSLQASGQAGVTVSQSGTTKGASGTFGGCFEIDAGFSINVGADASFFGFFNPGVRVPLYGKNFQVYQKCFGNGARSVRFASLLVRDAAEVMLENALTCPKAGVGAAQSVVNQVIASNAIKNI